MGINPGVVVGARDTSGGGRSTKDLAWQACQIHVADAAGYGPGDGLYDFLFVDQADFLGRRLIATVKYINEGRTSDGKQWTRNPACPQGWDVITNDNGWRAGDHALATQAWGHAKHYEVAETIGSLRNAAGYRIPAVTSEDLAFVRAVNRLTPPGGLTTGPVLRAEVTEQTDRLSRLSLGQQCAILSSWATAQTEPGARFASLFPLYNAGFDAPGAKHDTSPTTAMSRAPGSDSST